MTDNIPRKADTGPSGAALRRILIVDDHPLILAGLAAVVGAEPDLLVCGQAGTARQAMELIHTTSPDVVIMDLTLPDGNGLDLVKRLSSSEGGPRLLVCSIHDTSLFAQRALAAGAHGYLHKQEAITQVIAAIRKVLSGQLYLSADATQLVLQHAARDNGRLDGAETSIDDLTDRELEVFSLIGQGLNTQQIADHLHLSVKTVETHRAKIKRKLSLASTAELTRNAVQWVLEQH